MFGPNMADKAVLVVIKFGIFGISFGSTFRTLFITALPSFVIIQKLQKFLVKLLFHKMIFNPLLIQSS